jgi:secreted trypsin-like serine protease
LISRARAALASTLALAAGTALAASAPAEPPSRIVGGAVADPAAWPWIGSLQYRSFGGGGRPFPLCGATLIGPRAAITAAHCVESNPTERLSLVVGRPNLRDDSVGQRIEVRRATIHPRYHEPDYRWDIAVVQLERPAGVPSIAIPSTAQSAIAASAGAPLRIAGWGATRPRGGSQSPVLRQTSSAVIPAQRCKQQFPRAFSRAVMICVRGDPLPPPGQGRTSACFGDSGGPLVADTPAGPLLVAIVSGGGQVCNAKPAYDVRLASALGFIRRTTGISPPGD